ncbi:MAG: AmmeMemoRadiSam system radical SAM enzyme [Phycisphaerae bacterium]|nr:AmmeMemoRadiSam system radical SAM enzyme [Phycisphaerae bacterium]
MKEAVLWKAEADKVRCGLCSHRCLIAEGHTGRCGVRKNVCGILYSLNYDRICGAHADPIEKKPLYHFYPGSRSFSIAAEGCNFRCDFCQNWQISQSPVESGRIGGEPASPERIVEAAVRCGCRSLSYTYTEPTVFMELAADCARLAQEKGLANVFVSNGYLTPEAVDFAAHWLDAINVDLKAFADEYYRRLCKARLQPVLDTIRQIARDTRIWIEVTTLLVPGQNDGEDQLKALAEWLVREAGPQVPWHISRFYPQYKLTDAVPTPLEDLRKAHAIGKAAGLQYVYLGNMPGASEENTFCHACGRLLIERSGYTIVSHHIRDSCCPDCGARVHGVGWPQGQ